MAKKIFVVTGLGYGDEGKGKTVSWLCSKHIAHTVIRTGGPQAFHRVVLSSGYEHVHAQFGSGTLIGAATHLSRNMVVDPYAIISEGEALRDGFGINDIFERLTIHEDALVVTPFQAIANRLHELTRGDARYGSVGVGVGETVLDAELNLEETVRARDLVKPGLLDKLQSIRKRKLSELEEVIGRIGSLPQNAKDRARMEVTNLKDDDTLEWAIGWFSELASRVKIVDTSYLAKDILGLDGTVVFESSQGVLLDRYYGFYPYTTKVRTIPGLTKALIQECDYGGEVESLGVLRAYHTRHGAGPLVTENSELTNQLPDATNTYHQWQGKFRVGCFDLVAARYAIDVCGGTNSLDGLVITCVDRIGSLGKWEVCSEYDCSDKKNDPRLFHKDSMEFINGIKVSHGSGETQLKRQEVIGRVLGQCLPNTVEFKVKSDDVVRLCFRVLDRELAVPVVAVSTGSTEKDCIEFSITKKGRPFNGTACYPALN